MNSRSSNLADSNFATSKLNIDVSYQFNFIPYRLESKLKKKIINYLADGHIHEAPNNVKISCEDNDRLYMLMEKLGRISSTELQLLFEKEKEEGSGWTIDYLIGGLRGKCHLCPMEPRLIQDIRTDKFYSFNGGREMF